MPDINFSIIGKCGLIVLNRQNALNSLSSTMIKALQQTLTKWLGDQNVKYVLIKSVAGRAFCAGGDIREIYDCGQKNPQTKFFQMEYQLNALICNYPKPYIALINGIAMGGGVGISMHGSHVIVGEKTIFAMPETAIGFFPDIGSSYFLSRLPDNFGLYLGLTGTRLSAQELLDIGLADFFIESEKIEMLEEALCEKNAPDNPQITILKFCKKAKGHFSHKLAEFIKQIFASEPAMTMKKIKTNLQAMQKNESAANILKLLAQKSPLSLALTCQLLQRTSTLTIENCLKLEYRLTYRLLHGTEFYEGIRCAVIDKGQKPNWQNIENIDIENYFASLENKELRL